jgi:hypothetical protein
MGRRRAETPELGDQSEGSKWRNVLKTSRVASERIVALAHILYYIRCNLFHGSKNVNDSGDDSEIVAKSVEPLREILTAAITFTESRFR